MVCYLIFSEITKAIKRMLGTAELIYRLGLRVVDDQMGPNSLVQG